MILRKSNSPYEDSMLDDLGMRQGQVTIYIDVMKTRKSTQGFAVNDKRFGEFKHWNQCGLVEHVYVGADREVIVDLLLSPITDPMEKMLLQLTHGGPWIQEYIEEGDSK